MTRNEAIQRLKLLKGSFCVDTETALDMAIEALSAEPNDDIEGDIDFHCDLKHNRMTWYNNITESPNDVVETDDEVIDHDREWIIGCIKHDGFIKTDRFDKANRIILDALEPSGDLISRADAVEAVCGGCSIETKNNCKEEGDCYEVQNLKALPSAERVVFQSEYPLRMTEECAIELLQLTGWMQEHDKQISEPKRGGWIPLIHETDMTTNFPWERDGQWVIVTDGKSISVERFKKDAYDHFFPDGRWFEVEHTTAWMPLPQPYGAKMGVTE